MRFTLNSSVLIWPYYLMLIVGILLPSVTFRGLLNPKSMIFIGTIGSALLYILLRQKIYVSQLKVILFFILSLSFLTIWFLIGAVQDVTTLSVRIDQLKVFILTLSVPMLTLFFFNEKKVSSESFFKTVIYTSLFYCSLKILVVTLHIFGVIDIWKIMQEAGIQVMSMSIFGSLQRLQTSVDISTPFILFFVLQSEYLGLSINKRTKKFYILVSLLSNILSFSRFLMFIYSMSVVLYFFSASYQRVLKGVFVVITLLSIGIYTAGIDNVTSAVERRFFSNDNALSDQTRVDQINALMLEHDKVPYFGKGLGGFAPNLLRDQNTKHSYEVQWIAFLMQFGVFGIVILLIPLSLIAFQLLSPSITRVNLSFLALYILWILSGFTNPFLISLQSGIIYTLFLLVNKQAASKLTVIKSMDVYPQTL